jgi:hypothetical protein
MENICWPCEGSSKNIISYQLQKAPCSRLEFQTSNRMRSRHKKKDQ